MPNDSIICEKTEKPRIRDFDPSRAADLSALLKVDPLVSRFLAARGLDTPSAAADFLYPRMSLMHSPFSLQDMDLAVARIKKAVKKKETVALFSDSDIDGLTSLAIVHSVLESACMRVVYNFPTGDENYGLTRESVDFFAERGATLLITLDCGIRDCGEIAYASSLGIDVIVCDHHEQGESLPDAVVVDQKRSGSEYPFRDLAGAGTALKLCHGLLCSYLPMYQKEFCLICGNEAGLSVRIIKNGVRLFSCDSFVF
ncbi:MAG: DHH family phosphoesterase, partial [Spirochaetota bacterium]